MVRGPHAPLWSRFQRVLRNYYYGYCIYLFHNFKARRKYEEVLYCNVLCTVKKKLFIGVIIIRIRRSCREKKESFFQIIDYTVRV